jgi:hypothetical protein
VSSLPYGRRVTSTVTHPEWRLPLVDHSLDRACIAKCFAYGNYEPSTAQFRIRVHHGSPVVTDSVENHLEMQSGFYTVRKEDLPMNQIYQCDEKNLAKLCIRELSAGEQNGSVGLSAAQTLLIFLSRVVPEQGANRNSSIPNDPLRTCSTHFTLQCRS